MFTLLVVKLCVGNNHQLSENSHWNFTIAVTYTILLSIKYIVWSIFIKKKIICSYTHNVMLTL